MKVLICLILLASLLVADVRGQTPRRDESYPPPHFLARFKNIREVCREKTGATEEAIKEFSDGGIHEDPSMKCYMNCLFHEVKVVDDNGEVHFERLYEYVPDDLMAYVKPMLDGCKNPEGETQCDRAWWWHQCWKTIDPVHYFLP